MNTNKEGLTFVEWLNAAKCRVSREGGGTCVSALERTTIARKAWLAGEDPTEYRPKQG